jgi:hypothetical protein
VDSDRYEFLNDYKKHITIREDKKPINIFQIAGFPHYEMVASNILAFFLDPYQEHRMGDLVLKSFFDSISKNIPNITYDDFFRVESIQIRTEVPTKSNKKIDILIEDGNNALIIENKIWAGLYNDLNDYYNYVANDMLGEEQEKNVYLIILHLGNTSYNAVNYEYSKFFIQLSYDALINSIKTNITNDKVKTSYDEKSRILLYDFMENMEAIQRKGKTMMGVDTFQSLIKNKTDNIQSLMRDIKEYKNYCADRVKEVKPKVELVAGDLQTEQPWNYKPSENHLLLSGVVVDYGFNDKELSIDFYYGISPVHRDVGWMIKVFMRKNAGIEEYDNVVEEAMEKLPYGDGEVKRDEENPSQYWRMLRFKGEEPEIDELQELYKALIEKVKDCSL